MHPISLLDSRYKLNRFKVTSNDLYVQQNTMSTQNYQLHRPKNYILTFPTTSKTTLIFLGLAPPTYERNARSPGYFRLEYRTVRVVRQFCERYERIKPAAKASQRRTKGRHKASVERRRNFQRHLPQNYDKRLLYAYTRGCKHDMEKAKKKIELFFAVKSSQHDLYADRKISIPGDLNAMNFAMIVTLPEYTPEGYRVTTLKIINSDLDVFDQTKLIRFGLLVGDFRAHFDNLVGGEILIFDQGEATAALVSKSITNTLKRAIQIMQDVYPSLIKQVHILTDRAFVEKMFNVVKYFAKEKLRNRVHVHRSYEALSKYIPQKCLPRDYGGEQKSLDELNEEWKRLYVQQKDFFEELDKVKMCGHIPKRLVEAFNDEDSFGVQGSFRQLNID
ncbi:hypothetical protein Trydic_g23261 [Trypoxylus dichotomus]